MRPPKVTYDDVARACTRLISQGRHPTLDAIYEDVGRVGGRTTIAKHRKHFLEQFEKSGLAMLPSSFPEALVPIFEDVWNQSILHAGQRYKEVEADLESRMTALAEKAEDADRALVAETRKLDTVQTELAQTVRDLQSTTDDLASSKSECLRLQRLIDQLREDKERLNERIAQERDDANRRMDQAREEWAIEKAAFKDAVENLKTLSQASEDKQVRLTDYWTIQADDLRNQVRDLKAELKASKERHHTDLSIERTRIAQLINQIERLEADNRSLREAARLADKDSATPDEG